MREIKFRGKDLSTGEWAYGDLHTLCDQPHIHTETTSFPFAGKRSFIDPETIGQFTGLRDKKGKEIYEGDILFVQYDDDSHGIAVVGWNGKKARFGVMDNSLYRANVGEYSSHVLLDFLNNAVKCEVIGNKWDNPKLLES